MEGLNKLGRVQTMAAYRCFGLETSTEEYSVKFPGCRTGYLCGADGLDRPDEAGSDW